MSEIDIQIPTAFDPFAEANAEDSGAGSSKEYVHVRIQQRNGRKSLTTVQGLKKEFSYNKILKDLKKEFCCNGTVVQDSELGQVIQLQGDQRKNVSAFLVQVLPLNLAMIWLFRISISDLVHQISIRETTLIWRMKKISNMDNSSEDAMVHSQEENTEEDTKLEFSEEEKTLISRMYNLVGERWHLIAGRIPGRSAEEIEKYWTLKYSSES
ncbi:hypothetical protein GIB67_002588 [Kingdonia uniflora]|uniref:Uncharacterized protein n=2 Tax=Magnoliopsida TaxID=3398 RepID=A0A7J7N4P6_9MAGN|nr:hypothetical protein GIB67_002588 [Kingdonia uniflora]